MLFSRLFSYPTSDWSSCSIDSGHSSMKFWLKFEFKLLSLLLIADLSVFNAVISRWLWIMENYLLCFWDLSRQLISWIWFISSYTSGFYFGFTFLRFKSSLLASQNHPARLAQVANHQVHRAYSCEVRSLQNDIRLLLSLAFSYLLWK